MGTRRFYESAPSADRQSVLCAGTKS